MSSLTSPASSRTTSPGPQVRTRANRAALRQYYGLKEASSGIANAKTSPSLLSKEDDSLVVSELDGDSFDPEAYVRTTLDTKSLSEILKIENRLISEIRSLDGEKKALVYDNYSKLISATDTIRKMRDDMVPLTPEDSALNEDIAQIATLAGKIAERSAKQRHDEKTSASVRSLSESDKQKMDEIDTVKWVLGAPARLGSLVRDGKIEEAEKNWKDVQILLSAWEGVKGVAEIETECRKLMRLS